METDISKKQPYKYLSHDVAIILTGSFKHKRTGNPVNFDNGGEYFLRYLL